MLNPKDKRMKRNILTSVAMLLMLGSLYAQDASTQSSDGGDFAPSAGDFTGAILFGRGNYLTSGLSVPNSPFYYSNYPGNYGWTVSGQAPYSNMVDANSNSVGNIVGVEARYFFTNRITLKVSGGAILRNTPSFDNVPGYIPSVKVQQYNSDGTPVYVYDSYTQTYEPVYVSQPTPNAAWMPAYEAVKAEDQADVNVNIGGEYHFTTKFSRLFPYVGATIPLYYGRRSMYDPTINFGDLDNPTDPLTPNYIVDVGVRRAEIFGTGFQAVAGFDYYIGEGLYFGFETKPISYLYMYSGKNPAPGFESLDAKSTTWSFLTQTFLKVGIRF
jgi:outer membrane protein W